MSEGNTFRPSAAVRTICLVLATLFGVFAILMLFILGIKSNQLLHPITWLVVLSSSFVSWLTFTISSRAFLEIHDDKILVRKGLGGWTEVIAPNEPLQVKGSPKYGWAISTVSGAPWCNGNSVVQFSPLGGAMGERLNALLVDWVKAQNASIVSGAPLDFGNFAPQPATLSSPPNMTPQQTTMLEQKATDFAKEVEQIEQQYGMNHDAVSEAAYNAAEAYGELGKYSQARPLYEKAMAIQEALHGKDNSRLAQIVFHFAALSEKHEFSQVADSMFDKLFQMSKLDLVFSDVRNGYLAGIAEACDARSAFDTELKINERELDLNSRAYGEAHEETARSMFRLAVTLRKAADIARMTSPMRAYLRVATGQDVEEEENIDEYGHYQRAQELLARALLINGANNPDNGLVVENFDQISEILGDYTPPSESILKALEKANVYRRSPEDPELRAANQEARRRWPEFMSVYSERNEEYLFFVKAALVEDGLAEHIWISVESITAQEVIGKIDNVPTTLKKLKEGDEVSVLVSELEDWVVLNGEETILGGFTTKVLMKRANRS